MMIDILYIANARIPTEKAHGLAIMKMCEALSSRGVNVSLIIPKKLNKIKENPFEYYKVSESFKIKKIFNIDLVFLGKVGFIVQAIDFALGAFIYCLFKKPTVFYGRDELTLSLLSLFKKNVVWESHTAKNSFWVKVLLKRCQKLVVISNGLKNYYISLGVSSEKILVLASGVDVKQFDGIKESKIEIREKLGLPVNKKIVAYIGKDNTMGVSKGVDELKEVFKFIQEENSEIYLLIVADKPPKLLPLYMKASDVLIMNYPNMEHFANYMSPLKMFEYMASGRPIVTPDLPSIREVLNDNDVVFFKPGDSKTMSFAVEKVLADNNLAKHLSINVSNKAQLYTWDKRAQKIINFIKQ